MAESVHLTGASAADPLDALFDGSSEAICRVRREIRALAGTPFRCVLVVGETGTGKSRVAAGLARTAPHRTGEMVTVACGRLTTRESATTELFGSAGSDPGATARARGGVLLLDEVSALPSEAQGALLRLVEPGDRSCCAAPARDTAVVATTQEDLPAWAEQGRFRADVFYRLVEDGAIRMPALRERLDDIPALVDALAAEQGRTLRFSSRALSLLQAQPWPGNVRQLRAVTRAAAWLAEGGVVSAETALRALSRLAPRAAESAPTAEGRVSFRAATSELRRNLLIEALRTAGGNQTRAGILLGLHEPRHGGEAVPNLQARKLAHRKFRYWWTRLVSADPGNGIRAG